VRTSEKTMVVNQQILSQLKSGISISAKMANAQQKGDKNTEAKDENLVQVFENQEFNLVQLRFTWKAFTELKKADKDMNFAMTLSKHEPILVSKHLINYELDNEAQLELMKDHKKEILDYLREKLSNREIQLDFIMADENKENSRLYSPTDKFKYLAEKNPILLELQRRLDLNLDF
jgi:DNA polymerase III subunit gamma/tau